MLICQRFIREEIDDETIIKYKDDDGESKEMKAGSAKTMAKEHPAKIEYEKLKGDDDDEEEDTGQKLSGPKDFERELGSDSDDIDSEDES